MLSIQINAWEKTEEWLNEACQVGLGTPSELRLLTLSVTNGAQRIAKIERVGLDPQVPLSEHFVRVSM